MKCFDFSHWNLLPSMQGLLFFAQAMEEMLFHYGHDSLKVPALNFRFLCIEIQNTIKKIEGEIVDKGNMRPLIEELRNSFNDDCIAQQIFGNDFDSLFYMKSAEGEVNKNCFDLYKDPCSEKSVQRIKHVIDYLRAEMRINDRYYTTLIDSITETINSSSFEIHQQERLYKLTKIFLTDLINCSYSQEYIFWAVNDVFYNKNRKVDDINKTLEQFWTYFDFKVKNFTVVLPLKLSNLRKHFQYLKGVTVRDNDKKLFGNSCKWLVEIPIDAMDQYTAQFRAVALLNVFVSLLQYNNHQSQSYNADHAIIELKNKDGVIEAKYELKTPITPIKRGYALSDEKCNEKIANMVNNFRFFQDKLINAIELHSSALDSNEIGNQLLNLWTVIEVLIPTERKNSFSKIVQFCNVITTVLNAQYISSLITQLLLDLRHCIKETIESQLLIVEKGTNDIEKMAAILVLTEYQTEKSNIISALSCYPLLRYRIESYSFVLSDRSQIKRLLTAHRKRLSWHIMRIYRNRNMIVHDGSHFPYIDIIVQNLHHYVDTLIDTINLYADRGYFTLNTIFMTLQQKEYHYSILLEERGSDKKPKVINDDFAKVVLGYLD